MGRGFMQACVLILAILCLCQREVHGMITRPSKGRHGMRRESTPVKTIQSGDGDVIDCICIYEQPSLFHPSLMNHEIQMRPMTLPEREMEEGSRPRRQFKQAWHKKGRCPKGTIPIVRSRVLDERRTIERLFVSSNDQITFSSSGPVHEFAAVEGKFDEDYGVFGASADISVWNPMVLPGEFSCNMVSVASGDGGQIHEYIAAGWIVYDSLYGDFETRLFTYWSDFRDDWWLQVNGELVGYWPSSLFGYLNFWANTTLYGGQIYNTVPGGYHTLTQMGSGRFADEGYGRSCLISHIQYVNGDRKFKRLPDAAIVEDRPECYSLVYIGEDFMNKYGQFLYSGGPGLSLDCM
ncbi:uncharacterized protein LOC116254997 [Nymphaea colorata]|nr:uncharacterized protein LOC116254997 [Nymphaea colorata]